MVNQRENTFVRIINEPALSRIKNNQCPVCGKPKNEWNRRTDWRCCSVKCTEKFEDFCIIRNWVDLREQCFKRDNYTCVKCKKIPEKKIFLVNYSISYIKHLEKEEDFLRFEGKGIDKVAILIDDTKLIADHIIPIALGGEQWDINNLQTLCEGCNKEKTKEDAKNIAKLRSVEKRLTNGQKQLTGKFA